MFLISFSVILDEPFLPVPLFPSFDASCVWGSKDNAAPVQIRGQLLDSTLSYWVVSTYSQCCYNALTDAQPHLATTLILGALNVRSGDGTPS